MPRFSPRAYKSGDVASAFIRLHIDYVKIAPCCFEEDAHDDEAAAQRYA